VLSCCSSVGEGCLRGSCLSTQRLALLCQTRTMARLTLLLAFLAGALCAYASPPLHSAPVSMPRRLLLTRTLAVVRTTTTGCVLSFNIANNVHAILKHSQLATHSSMGGEWQGTRDTADRRRMLRASWSQSSTQRTDTSPHPCPGAALSPHTGTATRPQVRGRWRRG